MTSPKRAHTYTYTHAIIHYVILMLRRYVISLLYVYIAWCNPKYFTWIYQYTGLEFFTINDSIILGVIPDIILIRAMHMPHCVTTHKDEWTQICGGKYPST